ncbi:MAG TPA: hypothetical protein VME69_01265 [Methylocella sp.]|nr:hypothetical protein [Methylocella sp.]
MLDWTFILVGLSLLALLRSSALRFGRQNIARAVPHAVKIARDHGFVSPGRLMTQNNLSEKDARAVLIEACRRGLLFQTQDGRFYAKPLPPDAKVSSPEGRDSAQ